MAADIPDYAIGSQGVNIVASPIHTPDGGLLVAKNVEMIREFGIGGLGTRRGIAPLPGLTALAGDVQALVNAPFPLYTETDLLVALNSLSTPTWKSSSDGTTFSDLGAAVLPQLSNFPSTTYIGSGVIPRSTRTAQFGNRLYYIANTYTPNTTPPPLVVFDGDVSYTAIAMPQNPASPNPVTWVTDLLVYNEQLYVSVFDYDGTVAGANKRGRVFSYDPVNGTLLQVANRFGPDTGENTAGMPFCLTAYLGYLWAGTYGVAGNNQGKLYRLQPGVDTTWTLDLTGTLHNGYFMSVCGYRGQMFAGTDCDSSGVSIVQVRASDGTWTTSLTSPDSGIVTYYSSLIVFDNKLYAGYYGNNSGSTLVKQYDGASWATDKNISTDLGAHLHPGKPFVFNNALYWPFFAAATGDSGGTNYLLKRTTGGVWSTVLSGTTIFGGLGRVIPAP